MFDSLKNKKLSLITEEILISAIKSSTNFFGKQNFQRKFSLRFVDKTHHSKKKKCELTFVLRAIFPVQVILKLLHTLLKIIQFCVN